MNCKVGAKAFEDAEEVSYAVDVDRARNSAVTLRESDVSQRFLDMGLCSACASNVTAVLRSQGQTPRAAGWLSRLWKATLPRPTS